MKKLLCRYLSIGLFLLLCVDNTPAYCQTSALPIIKSRHLFTIDAGLLHPSDVAVGPQGRIYVVDGVHHQIKIYNRDGTFISSFGSQGSAGGSFHYPLGLDVSREGSVYVADAGNHRVQIFDASGLFLQQFSLPPPKNAKMSDPSDVAVDDTTGRCYVVDNDNHRILVYTKDGSRLIKIWGESGEKLGQFQYPFLVSMDRHAHLYVVDVLNTRVQAFNPEGRVMAYIGKWGVDRGQFYRPKGVTVDHKDRIFISDSYLGVIQIFKRFRKFIGILGDQAGEMLRFKTPTGIYIDTTLRLYVVEMAQNRVSVYQILE